MGEFILAYRGSLRTFPAIEEATTAGLSLRPAEGVDGIKIYEIEEVGYISRGSMIATQKLARKEKTNEDNGGKSAA